jgi:hypothetical protein
MISSFSGDAAYIESELGRFLGDLVTEGLLVPAAGHAAPALGEPEPGRPKFTPPVLGKYTDMQELLLQDPVHEVDAAAGWPHPKPQA